MCTFSLTQCIIRSNGGLNNYHTFKVVMNYTHFKISSMTEMSYKHICDSLVIIIGTTNFTVVWECYTVIKSQWK